MADENWQVGGKCVENCIRFDFGEFWFSNSRFGFGLNQFESSRITRSQSKMTN